MFGNYGSILDFNVVFMQCQGMDKLVQDLVKVMSVGWVDVLFVMDGVNFVFDLFNVLQFCEVVLKVGLKVFFFMVFNEMVVFCDYIMLMYYYLESWGDVEFKCGYYSLI